MKNMIVSNKPVVAALFAGVSLLAFVTGIVGGNTDGLWRAAAAIAVPAITVGVLMACLFHERKSKTAKQGFENGVYIGSVGAGLLATIHTFGTWGANVGKGPGAIVFSLTLLAIGTGAVVWLLRKTRHQQASE